MKKFVKLFAALFIAIGVFALLEPIYAASNLENNTQYQNCKNHYDGIHQKDCPNNNEQNCLEEMNFNHQMNNNCSEIHQNQNRSRHNCYSQNKNEVTSVVHHHRQKHHK